MRHIDLETWTRREQFNLLSNWDYPHFSLCANVDLTAFYPYVKNHAFSFNVAIVYVLARAANTIPEFRYRIRAGAVVEHDIVHPSTTILTKGDLFSFCHLRYTRDFSLFAVQAAEQIAYAQENPMVKNDQEQDDLLYLTAIPWVSFTGFMHPLDFPVDSVPRLAWGKFFQEGDYLKMPLNVQAHHALMDGIHMGQFYAEVQSYLSHPASVLGEA